MFPIKRISGRAISGVALVLLGFAAIPPVVLSQNNAEGTDPVAIYKQAGINAEQESNIRKLAQDYDQADSVRMKTLGGLLQELRNLAYQSVLDADAMLAKQDQINKLQSEMAMQRIKLVIKVRSILTPAQNDKLATILQRHLREGSEDQGSQDKLRPEIQSK